MKTLIERVPEALEIVNGAGSQEDREARLLTLFKEIARDQRHSCAEAVQGISSNGFYVQERIVRRAHAAAMNAPEPGR